MPQPALHLLQAEATLDHWRERPADAPFDVRDDTLANAFRNGCLAPDYGLFPGGDASLSAITHRGRSGALVRSLFEAAAADPIRRAFSCGWLAHALADVAIHPLINDAAAAPAGAAGSLADHVRVEVGVDVHFCRGDERLRTLRLRPVFDDRSFTFLSDALAATHEFDIATTRLVRMQRGMIRFTHAALHFATSLAGELCWDGRRSEAVRRHPATTALWYLLTTASSRHSKVYAYLNPVRPSARLAGDVTHALDILPARTDTLIADGLRDLPDYNLETGTITDTATSAR